jgi:endonuclease/exonuclease/phosphatase family metal-dependent hydrolase
MRRAAILVLVVLTSGCARTRIDTPSSPPASSVLAVITWNMDAGRGDLPGLLSDLTSSQLTDAALPYVFLLQEAAESDVAALARERALHLFFAPVRGDGGSVRGNAIVSTTPLANTRIIPLPQERQPRNAAFATLEIRGQPFFVVSAHFENRVAWWRGGLVSDRARRRQAEALLREIPQEGPAVVGGDFNTWLGPAEPAWRLLMHRFADTPADPSPTFRDRLVLDHLFFDLPAVWSASRRVVEQRYRSNHHPVLGLVSSRE